MRIGVKYGGLFWGIVLSMIVSAAGAVWRVALADNDPALSYVIGLITGATLGIVSFIANFLEEPQ